MCLCANLMLGPEGHEEPNGTKQENVQGSTSLCSSNVFRFSSFCVFLCLGDVVSFCIGFNKTTFRTAFSLSIKEDTINELVD